MRNYEREDIYSFGRHLLESGDLDPVYIALHKAELEPHKQARFLVAYFSYYHVGAAAYLADSTDHVDFWDGMTTAAENTEPTPLGTRWPRGHERRHARGAAGIKMVQELSKWEDPQAFLDYIAYLPQIEGEQPLEFAAIAQRVRSQYLFGDWIAFKIGDVLDRLNIRPVDFDQAAVFMFKDPAKAAEMLFREHFKVSPEAKVKLEVVIPEVVEHLNEHFKEFSAPPLHDRRVGLQEIETILCKWKSHRNGHYPRFNDITEIRQGLTAWTPHSDTAKALLWAMPKGAE